MTKNSNPFSCLVAKDESLDAPLERLEGRTSLDRSSKVEFVNFVNFVRRSGHVTAHTRGVRVVVTRGFPRG